VKKTQAPASAEENLYGFKGQVMSHYSPVMSLWGPSIFQTHSFHSLSFTHSHVSSLTHAGPFRPVLTVIVFKALWRDLNCDFNIHNWTLSGLLHVSKGYFDLIHCKPL